MSVVGASEGLGGGVVIGEALDLGAEPVDLGVCPPGSAVFFSALLDGAHLLMPCAALVGCFHCKYPTLVNCRKYTTRILR